METGLHQVVEKIVERRIGKLTSIELLYGGSDRSFLRIVGRRGSLVLLNDADSRMLDNYLIIGRYLRSIGDLAPEIFEHLWEYNIILMEDLGDRNLLSYVSESDDPSDIYENVIELLILLQSSGSRKELPVVVSKNPFDHDRLMGEFGQFSDFFLHGYLSKYNPDTAIIQKSEREARKAFIELAGEIHRQPKLFMHRDFQSTNIIVHKDRMKVIDFQSAAIGPYTYDLVSVVEDPYIQLKSDLRRSLKLKYIDRMHEFDFIDIDRAGFWTDYDNSAVSRLLQAVGAYARLTAAGKSRFEKYILPALRTILEHTGYEKSRPIANLCQCAISIIEEGNGKA